MRKRIAVALVLPALFALVAFVPVVQVQTLNVVAMAGTYVFNMSPQGSDVAFARASGGANCYVQSGLTSYFRDQAFPTHWYHYAQVDFESYSYIKGQIKVTMDAPGWFDESYYSLQVFDNFQWKETLNGSRGGSETFWVYTSQRTMGTEGTWTFIISVWGLDSGSQTCRAQGEFQVTDI